MIGNTMPKINKSNRSWFASFIPLNRARNVRGQGGVCQSSTWSGTATELAEVAVKYWGVSKWLF